MKKFYRMTNVPEAHARELRLAAAELGTSRAEAFERLTRAGELLFLIRSGLTECDPGGETLTMAIDAEVKDEIDQAAAKTGVLVQSVGRMVLAALAGRMDEVLREAEVA